MSDNGYTIKCGRSRLSWTTQVLPEQRVPSSRSASCPGQWKVGCKHSDCLPHTHIFSYTQTFSYNGNTYLLSQMMHRSGQRADMVRVARFEWDSEGACGLINRGQSTQLILTAAAEYAIFFKLSLHSFRKHAGVPWHTRTQSMPLHPPSRARIQHHHTGLHETRTARFKQNVVYTELCPAFHRLTGPTSLSTWPCITADLLQMRLPGGTGVAMAAGMRVGLLWLGCGQSEALSGRTRASRHDKIY